MSKKNGFESGENDDIDNNPAELFEGPGSLVRVQPRSQLSRHATSHQTSLPDIQAREHAPRPRSQLSKRAEPW